MQSPPPLPEPIWSSIPPDAREALAVAFDFYRNCIERLEARVRELQARLDQNSSNSSKPPSSDPPGVKPAPPKPPSGKKPGAQDGHTRCERVRLEPDTVVDHKPLACSGCGSPLTGSDDSPRIHQVWELPVIRPTVAEHRFHRLACACGRTTAAPVPADVPADGYGPRLKAAAVYLTGVAHLSKAATERLCEDLLGTPISTGQICAIEAEAAERLAPVIGELRAALPLGDACMDETGWKQSGKRCWLWVAVTVHFTFFHVSMKRNREAVEFLLGASYAYVLSTDRCPVYARVARRQLCWAHLRRDFQGLIDRGGEGKTVGVDLLLLSDLIFNQWHKIRDGTAKRKTAVRRIENWLVPDVRRVLLAGAESPCARTSRFCRTLLEAEGHLWSFCRVEGVEPTNNAAERALRPAVLWRKASQGTRSDLGSRYVATMLSVSTTCKQQGRRVWDYLTQTFASGAAGRAVPSLLQMP